MSEHNASGPWQTRPFTDEERRLIREHLGDVSDDYARGYYKAQSDIAARLMEAEGFTVGEMPEMTLTIQPVEPTGHNPDNPACPLNDPETHMNPATAGLPCNCGTDTDGKGRHAH